MTFIHYEMYTDEGNQAVADAVDELIESGLAGEFPATQLTLKVQKLQDDIVAAGHAEVHDTEPEWNIVDQINVRLCEPMCWKLVTRDF